MKNGLRPGELPPDAVAILKAAADVGEPGSLENVAAIDAASRRVEDLYPEFFRKEVTQMETVVMLRDVRLAFPELWEAKTVNGEGKPAFSATFLLNPISNKTLVLEVNAAIDEVAKATWGAKADGVLKALRAGDKVCLRAGDSKADYAGFEGMLFISARSQIRPKVIDRNKTDLVAADGRPYAGCYVNAQIAIWAQDNNFGKRINAQLKGVQFVRDGDAFSGGAPASADDFDDLSDGADAEAELV